MGNKMVFPSVSFLFIVHTGVVATLPVCPSRSFPTLLNLRPERFRLLECFRTFIEDLLCTEPDNPDEAAAAFQRLKDRRNITVRST